MDAATGTFLDSKALGFGLTASGVALSSTGEYAFVGAMVDSVPEFVVFAVSDTLNYLGRMSAPVNRACSSCGPNLLFQAGLAVDDATGTVFLVSQGEPALIWEFDLLP